MFRVISVALFLSLALAASSPAGSPQIWEQQMNYQGQLTDSAGNAVADGNYNVTFRIYDDPSGGALLWNEGRTITTNKGLFNVSLGSVTPLNFGGSLGSYYLTLQVSGDPEMTPRQPLLSTPYAFNSLYSISATAAASANNATNATNATNAVNLQNPGFGNQPVGTSARNIVALDGAGKIPSSLISGSAVTAPLDLTASSTSYVLRVHNTSTGLGLTVTTASPSLPAAYIEGANFGLQAKTNGGITGVAVEAIGPGGTGRAYLINVSRNAFVHGYAPTGGIPVLGEAGSISGIGVVGSGGSSGIGVSGSAGTWGVYGISNNGGVYGSGGAYGVYGTTVNNYGLFGQATGSGLGVYGYSAGGIAGYFTGVNGLYGSSGGGSGNWGVQGINGGNATGFLATGSTGVSATGATLGGFFKGLTGVAASGSQYGAFFQATATSGATYGVYVDVSSTAGYGVYSRSRWGGRGGYFEGQIGIEAYGRNSVGVNAYSDTNNGIQGSGWGSSSWVAGVYGEGRTGVYGYAEGGQAMRAYQGDVGWGLVAEGYYETPFAAILAYSSSGGHGIKVSSTAGIGIEVESDGKGLIARSTSSYAADLRSDSGSGILINAPNSYAIDASSLYGYYSYANYQGYYAYTYGTNAYGVYSYAGAANSYAMYAYAGSTNSYGLYAQASVAGGRAVNGYVGTCINCHAGYFENLTYGASAGQFSGSALFVNGRATLTSMANTFTLTTTLGITSPATVTNRYMNSSDVVVITPRGDISSGGRYWVSSQSNGQFVVAGSGLPNGSITFNYLIIGR